MPFKLKIENFGKLADAEIDIGRFTVFAGPNNTGKSTVSKALYSVFDSMNANHTAVYLDAVLDELRSVVSLRPSFYRKDEEDSEFVSLIEKEMNKAEQIIRMISDKNTDEVEIELSEFVRIAEGIVDMYKTYQVDEDTNEVEIELSEFVRIAEGMVDMYKAYQVDEDTSEVETELSEFLRTVKNMAEEDDASILKVKAPRIGQVLLGICEKIDGIGKLDAIVSGIQVKIRENMIHNFQVANFSHLRRDEGAPAAISINDADRIELTDNSTVHFKLSGQRFETSQEYSRVIYLESPFCWKLKEALENIRLSPRFRSFRNRQRLDNVPGYFYDLARELRGEYTGEIAFSELYKNLTSEEVLAGKIVISNTGELLFQQAGRSFSLHLTAMGVINLGILALLIEKKILDRGTFLFIDEPEAHLHPAWQVVMAETLFELARQGVNVVIATHSADILKWLEVHIKQNPENKPLVALNHFSREGVTHSAGDNGDIESMLFNIKEELMDPFAKLYIKGI